VVMTASADCVGLGSSVSVVAGRSYQVVLMMAKFTPDHACFICLMYASQSLNVSPHSPAIYSYLFSRTEFLMLLLMKGKYILASSCVVFSLFISVFVYLFVCFY